MGCPSSTQVISVACRDASTEPLTDVSFTSAIESFQPARQHRKDLPWLAEDEQDVENIRGRREAEPSEDRCQRGQVVRRNESLENLERGRFSIDQRVESVQY